MNKKQIIRLRESDLHRIIKESVKRLLKESNLYENDYTLPNGGFDNYAYKYDSALRDAESIDDWDKKMKDREEYAKTACDNAQYRHPQRFDKYGSVGSSIYVNPKLYNVDDPLKKLADDAEWGIKQKGFPT